MESILQKSKSIAFVGGAPNSAVGYAHFAAAQMDSKWKLVAGAFSRNPQMNQEAAGIYGIGTERTYATLEKLVLAELENLDAIAILTPTPDHFNMVKFCLEQGVPVICEKSLTTTAAEAKLLQQLRQEKNVFLAVIYNYSGYPMIRELRKLIQSGKLGRILHFQVEMPQEGFLRTDDRGNKPTPQDWRKRDGSVPTIHLDLAVHLHQLIYYLTGQKPEEVISDQSSRRWFPGVYQVSCLARYSQGIQGQFWFSKCALGHRNGLRLRIYGSDAAAEWYQMNPEELLVSYQEGRRQILDRACNPSVAGAVRYNRFKSGHPAGYIEALANLYADIFEVCSKDVNAMEKRSEEVFGVDLAVEGLEFLEAMVRSVESRTWEKC